MSGPAMPSPARIVSSSIAHLVRKGYSRAQARRVVCDAIEAIGQEKAHFEPWAVDWLRKLWAAADKNGAASGPPVTDAGAPPASPEGSRS